MKERGSSYKRGVPELPRAYHRIMDGDRIMIGGREWAAIAGYGHAPEHVSLHCAETARADFRRHAAAAHLDQRRGGVGRRRMPIRCALFLDSIARYARELPAKTLVLPSHGLPFRGVHERVAQLQAHHDARLDELERPARRPRPRPT